MKDQDLSLLIIYMLISVLVDEHLEMFSEDCLNTLADCHLEIRKLVSELDEEVSVSDLIQAQFQSRFAKSTLH